MIHVEIGLLGQYVTSLEVSVHVVFTKYESSKRVYSKLAPYQPKDSSLSSDTKELHKWSHLKVCLEMIRIRTAQAKLFTKMLRIKS